MRCRKYLALWAMTAMVSWAVADDPAASPPAAPPRPAVQILRDWQATSQSIRALLPSPRDLRTPEARAEVAPAALPLLRKAVSLANEMYWADPETRSASRRNHYHLLAVMAFLGDAQAMAELDDARQSNHREIGNMGRRGWYLARWWQVASQIEAAAKMVDEIEQCAIASPEDDGLASLLLQMREDLPGRSPLAARIETILTTHLRGPLAQQAAAQFKSAEKRRSLLGKPLVLKTTTLSGELFSTQSLVGHTVILHFGQTTSQQWEQQHNRLLQLAPDLPAGVVLISILCDESDDVVRTYAARHKEIPWTVLRDRNDPVGFAAQYGVEEFATTLVLAPDGTVAATDVIPDGNFLQSLPATRPVKQ